MLFSRQIPLQLIPRQDSSFDNFIVGPNASVIEAVKLMSNEAGSHVFLSGEAGSGKTHLLNALCHSVRANDGRAFYLALERLPENAIGSLQGLERQDLVCVDDLHVIAGSAAWEEALFHCFNRIRKAGGRLLVSSRLRLSALNLELPDLASRLTWGLRLRLEPLNDGDKLRVLAIFAGCAGENAAGGVDRQTQNYGTIGKRGA